MLAAFAFVLGVAEAGFMAKLMRDKGADTIEEFMSRATVEEMLRASGHSRAAFLLWGVAAILSIMQP